MIRWLTLFLAGWALALTAGFPAGAQAPARQVPVDLALVLAVDVSGSVDEEEGALQRRGYVDAITDPEIVRAITSGILGRVALAYFEWAGDGWQVPVIGWTVIDGAQAASAFAARLADAPIGSGPWTSISGAIDFGAALHAASPVEATRRVIDISGDGPTNTGAYTPDSRDAAVEKGITINGLTIMNERLNFGRVPMPNLDLYYRHCVIGGPGAFVIVANGFKDFAQAVRRKLILEIAGRQPDGSEAIAAAGYAQAAPPRNRDRMEDGRWVPPCNEGERRFRGVIDDE